MGGWCGEATKRIIRQLAIWNRKLGIGGFNQGNQRIIRELAIWIRNEALGDIILSKGRIRQPENNQGIGNLD
jgi:hypothetical protein